tara:strand:- start:1527 stop:2123 length:597 start_codon:yes stop_codon:yes gene_type:complete
MKIVLYLFIIYLIITQINFINFTLGSYDVNNNILYNKKQLIVSTHDYEHIDIFIMLDEIIKSNDKVTIVFADKLWNRFLYYYLKLRMITNIDFIFVNGGTVSNITDVLNKDQTVLIYLYRDNLSSGIYYSLKDSLAPLILCKITSDHKNTILDKGSDIFTILYENFNCHYDVDFISYNYNIFKHKKDFMRDIQNKLYL